MSELLVPQEQFWVVQGERQLPLLGLFKLQWCWATCRASPTLPLVLFCCPACHRLWLCKTRWQTGC